MSLNDKLQRIILEYTVHPGNHHVGTGTGGNIEHYMFISNKKIVSSPTVESLKINGDELLYNPTYVTDTGSKEIRLKLDEIISAAIVESNFNSPIKFVKEENSYKLVMDDSNLEQDSLSSRLILASRKCAEFAQKLETDAVTDETFAELVTHLSTIELPAALFAIRTQIGIEKIVRFNLDENKILAPFLHKINQQVE